MGVVAGNRRSEMLVLVDKTSEQIRLGSEHSADCLRPHQVPLLYVQRYRWQDQVSSIQVFLIHQTV